MSDDIIGEPLGLVDFLKAHPVKALDSLADAMKREGGDHPFAWCVSKLEGKAEDARAVCASAHMKAYGVTPAQRRAQEKA